MERAPVRIVLEILVLAPERRLLNDFKVQLVVCDVKANPEIGELIVLEYQAQVLVLRQPPDRIQFCQQILLLLLVFLIALPASVYLFQFFRLLHLHGFLLLELG